MLELKHSSIKHSSEHALIGCGVIVHGGHYKGLEGVAIGYNPRSMEVCIRILNRYNIKADILDVKEDKQCIVLK